MTNSPVVAIRSGISTKPVLPVWTRHMTLVEQSNGTLVDPREMGFLRRLLNSDANLFTIVTDVQQLVFRHQLNVRGYQVAAKLTMQLRPDVKASRTFLNTFFTRGDSPVFSELNSYYAICLKRIADACAQPKTRAEVYGIINAVNGDFGFQDAYQDINLDQLCNSGILRKQEDGEDMKYVSAFCDNDCRPLTAYERRWLYTILQDEKIGLFLTEAEAENLRRTLEKVGCEVLYDAYGLRAFDACRGGDPYRDEAYVERFQRLCCAIEEGNRVLEVDAVSPDGDALLTHRVLPCRLEYSRADEQFTLLAYEIGEAASFQDGQCEAREMCLLGLSDIRDVRDCADIQPSPDQYDRRAAQIRVEEPLEIRVYPFKNVIERFFIAFSGYRRAVEHDTQTGVCHVKLWYIARDHEEICTRLQSFGQGVEVLSPQSVREEFIRRVDRQYFCLLDRGLIKACEKPVTVKVREERLSGTP